MSKANPILLIVCVQFLSTGCSTMMDSRLQPYDLDPMLVGAPRGGGAVASDGPPSSLGYTYIFSKAAKKPAEFKLCVPKQVAPTKGVDYLVWNGNGDAIRKGKVRINSCVRESIATNQNESGLNKLGISWWETSKKNIRLKSLFRCISRCDQTKPRFENVKHITSIE